MSCGARDELARTLQPILGNLYAFLVDHNYLIGNLWSSVTVPRGPARVNAGRSFTAAKWVFIEETIREAKATPANQRRGAPGQGQHALAQAHPRQSRHCWRHADRSRSAKLRPRVAGDDHGLRQDRGEKAHEGGQEVLGGEGGGESGCVCSDLRARRIQTV
jgi:hypothetical protein